MGTNEETLIKLSDDADNLKSDYMTACSALLEQDRAGASKDVLRSAFEGMRRSAIRYFNHWEQFVARSDLLGANRNDRWVTTLAEDCCVVLGSAVKHQLMCRSLSEKYGIAPADPSTMAYAGLQRMVVEYLPASEAEKCRATFEVAGLPVYGFEHPLKKTLTDPSGASVQLEVTGTSIVEKFTATDVKLHGQETHQVYKESGLLGALFGRTVETRVRQGEYADTTQSNNRSRHTLGWGIAVGLVICASLLFWLIRYLLQ